ncbi:MAG: hypothetical protein IT559_09355 [Alphaproteobacteria bacterium]|nr:hypothetical protein [Alphaproteobacteria bacterium]
MLVTIGYGLNAARHKHVETPFPAPFIIENRPRGTAFYDSVGNQFRAQVTASGSFNDLMKTYFDPTTAGGVQDMSTDGCSILKSVEVAAGGAQYLINDDSGADPAGWTRGATYYTAVKNAMSTGPETSDYAIIISGTNDANPAGGNTKAKHKQALAKLKQFIREDFIYSQCGFLHILHRSDFAGSSDTLYQAIREAQLEMIAEDDWFKRMPDMYDLDQADQSHFTTGVYQTAFASRYAKAVAYVFGKIPTTGVYGPEVTAAEFNTDHLLLSVAHDGGSDFATIPALAENTIGLEIGSVIYKPSSITRVDATTLKCNFENIGLLDGAIGAAKIVYGTMEPLSLTAPEVVKDNATDARPLRSSVLSAVNNDPLWNIHDLDLDLIAKTGTKTFSGSDVTGITDRMNGTWTSPDNYWPYYDAAAFGGAGALTSPDGTTLLISGAPFTKSNTGWGGIVFEAPAVTASNKYLLTFGLNSGGGNQNTFYMTTGGALYMQRNQSNAPVLISGAADLRGQKHILIWNYRSTGAVDVYLNNNAVVTFDPSDNLISWDYITLFNRTFSETGGTVGFKIARLWHRHTAHGVNPDDPAIAAVIAFFNAHYGLGLES